VNFFCVDETSGSLAAGVSVETREGMGLSNGATCIDNAGNIAAITGDPLNIDKTPPVVSFNGTCPTSLNIGDVAEVTVAVSDGLSGIASQSVPNGPAPLDTATVGEKTFSVTALDVADNGATDSCVYQVQYIFGDGDGGGFGPPLLPPPVVNTARAGAVVPVKWQLSDGSGGFISDLSVVAGIFFQQARCLDYGATLENPVETETSGKSGLHYDSTANQFIYNWKTQRSMSGNCYILILRLDDGSDHVANFKLN
jgi:hypothetical protein